MKKLYVISETHWDREWYNDFQEYRARLVRMVDELIETLETVPEYKYFHFDGQTIVIEDYLKIRPENRERLMKLIKDGKLIVGPWYVMPDLFLISGESLVRNLQKGFALSREYGAEPLNCGYIVDMFGQSNQFPQILKGFNIDNAIFFRGIGDYPKDAFIWKGKDGTKVTVHKLDPGGSYGNFFFAARHHFKGGAINYAEQVEFFKNFLNYCEERATGDVFIMFDGIDHIDIEPNLPKIIKNLKDNIPDIEIVHSNYDTFRKAFNEQNLSLETLEGCFHNAGKKGMNNIVLKNVLSSHVELKQANDKCETMLTKVTEPLNAAIKQFRTLGILGGNENEIKGREAFLKEAWEFLIKNHPHDSICGCSNSDVHLDNACRFRQTESIAKTLNKNMRELLAAATDTTGKGEDGAIILYNPTSKKLTGVNVFDIPFPLDNEGRITVYDASGNEVRYQRLSNKEWHDFDYSVRKMVDLPGYDLWTVAIETEVEAGGYAVLTFDNKKVVTPKYGDYNDYVEFYPPVAFDGSMKTAPRTFDTGKITVTFEADGTLTVLENDSKKEYRGVLMFEDTGDKGDGWSYKKPLMDETYLSGNAEVSVLSDGPLCATVKITTTMRIPKHLKDGDNHRSEHFETLKIDSVVTLLKGSDRIDVKTTVDNNCYNHRLRVLIPTYIDTDKVYTKIPFGMYAWDIAFTDYSRNHEPETFVFPSQGITLLKGKKSAVGLYTKGLYEVAVSDNDSKTIALTLFRSFTNEFGFGEKGLGRMLEKRDFEYSIHFCSKLTPESAFIEGENVRIPLAAKAEPVHSGTLPNKMAFMGLDDNKNFALSNIDTCENGVNVRLVNISDKKASCTLSLIAKPKAVKVVNFLGEETDSATAKITDKGIKITADGAKIVTLNIEI